MNDPIATFKEKVPSIASNLSGDFSLDLDSISAILGNLGYESDGFTALQERGISPPYGGFGWAQWTGSRRRGYESYCRRNALPPTSDKANYAYLFLELKGQYRGAINAVKTAGTLHEKVMAFERTYEKAGIKNYSERIKWAERAKEILEGAGFAAPIPPVQEPPGWFIGMVRALWDAFQNRKNLT